MLCLLNLSTSVCVTTGAQIQCLLKSAAALLAIPSDALWQYLWQYTNAGLSRCIRYMLLPCSCPVVTVVTVMTVRYIYMFDRHYRH